MVKGPFKLEKIQPIDWKFAIDVNVDDDDLGFTTSAPENLPTNDLSVNIDDNNNEIPEECVRIFERDGFIVFPEPILSNKVVTELNRRLEEILRGRYTRQMPPDKAPRIFKTEYEGSPHIGDHQNNNKNSNQKNHISREERRVQMKRKTIVGPIGFSGNYNHVRVIQVINVHKADHLFRRIATDPRLGKWVARLAGWNCGARLAQDQIWAKPPRAAPLAFHRDSPYFMFEPADVVTVWLALDDMTEELGPLQYVKGSHKWGEGRVGIASQFFESDGGIDLLHSAAERHNGDNLPFHDDNYNNEAWTDDLEIVSMAGLLAGCVSIHNGRTWHGSGQNQSRTKPRRGLGLHFVPANARFTAEAYYSQLWRPYVQEALENDIDPATIELNEQDFPVTWTEKHLEYEQSAESIVDGQAI